MGQKERGRFEKKRMKAAVGEKGERPLLAAVDRLMWGKAADGRDWWGSRGRGTVRVFSECRHAPNDHSIGVCRAGVCR